MGRFAVLADLLDWFADADWPTYVWWLIAITWIVRGSYGLLYPERMMKLRRRWSFGTDPQSSPNEKAISYGSLVGGIGMLGIAIYLSLHVARR